MANSKNNYPVQYLIITVEREIAGAPTGDDKLVKTMIFGTSDEWVMFQWRNCALNQVQRLPGSARVLPHQKIYQAFNIRQCAFGVLDFRHELSFDLLGALW